MTLKGLDGGADTDLMAISGAQIKNVRRGVCRAVTATLTLGAVIAIQSGPALGGPLVKGSTTNSRVGVSYLAVAKPATAAKGDVLVGLVSVNQSSASGIVPPAGWTLHCSKAATGTLPVVQTAYSRVTSASEPASYTWSFPSNSGAVIGILNYGGGDVAQPVGSCAGSAATATNRITAPAIATTVANETVIAAFAFRGSGTTAPPLDTSEWYDNKTAVDSSRSVSASAADYTVSLAGTAPAKVGISSLSAPASGVGIQLSLRPSPATTTTTTAAPTTSSTTSTSATTSTTTASTTTPPKSPTIEDRFDGTDGIITSPLHYLSASFPLGGTSASTNPSPLWEGDSGKFHRQSGWGYSGRPIDWANKYFFRYNTRDFSIGDATVSWQYRSGAFGQDGYPVEGSDAASVWLRYQTQYDLYVLQFDRTNNCMQAKRKLPAQGWSGPSSLISNKGVYYSLQTDAAQPIFGAGQYCVTWNGVKGLLPAGEAAKPGFPNLAHDGATMYDFKASIRTLPDGRVQIQGYRAGVLVYSVTDDGRSALAANGETQGAHLDRGYYTSVAGWQSAWGRPITRTGAAGFRADNIPFWLDNLTVQPLP